MYAVVRSSTLALSVTSPAQAPATCITRKNPDDKEETRDQSSVASSVSPFQELLTSSARLDPRNPPLAQHRYPKNTRWIRNQKERGEERIDVRNPVWTQLVLRQLLTLRDTSETACLCLVVV